MKGRIVGLVLSQWGTCKLTFRFTPDLHVLLEDLFRVVFHVLVASVNSGLTGRIRGKIDKVC